MRRSPAISLLFIRSSLFSGDPAANLDAFARGNIEQIGGAPDQVVLELVEAAVSIDDFPHHLDNAPPPLLVERAIDAAGEVVEIDRFVLGGRRFIDKLGGGGIVEVEPVLEHG